MQFQNISINLNDKCNLGCKYCFYDNKTNAEMSEKTIKKTVDFIKKYGVEPTNIWFFGSEPTLSLDIMMYITECLKEHNSSTRLGVTTNLVSVPEHLFSFWKNNRFHINVSYDGVWHDEYRVHKDGSPSSEKVRANIKKLQENNIPFTVLMSMVPKQENRFLESIIHVYNLGVRGIAMNKIIDSYNHKYNWCPLNKNFEKIADWYASIYKTDNKFSLQFLHKSLTKNPNQHKNRWTCGACFGSISIEWNGDVMICQRAEDPIFKIGNVDEGIDENRVNMFRRLEGYWRCPTCAIKDDCSICYVTNKLMTGNILDYPDSYCRWEFIRVKAGNRFRELVNSSKVQNIVLDVKDN